MSIISDYYKFYRGGEPSIDFEDTIRAAISLLITKIQERDARDDVAVTKPWFTAVEDITIPDEDFGFKIMPAVYRKERKSKGKWYEEIYDVYSTKSVKREDRSEFEPVEGIFPPQTIYSDVTFSSRNQMGVCLLYNLELGEAYYLSNTAFVSVGKRIKLVCGRAEKVIYSFNWITGKAYTIPFPEYTELFPTAKKCWKETEYALEEIKAKDVPQATINCPLFGMLEAIYNRPENMLKSIKAAYEELGWFIESAQAMTYHLASLLVYTGNLFQSLLQTLDKSHWFLPLLMRSLNMGNPMKQQFSNIRNWLGLSKPIYDKLLAEPNEKRFVFFMCMKMYDSNVSYETFENVYEKVLKLDVELSENADKSPYHSCYSPVHIKGPYGRRLFTTTELPRSMYFYSKHSLYKTISINHYYKWLLSECYLMVKLGKHDRDAYIYGIIEKLTEDHNRMAKEIIPNAKFTLPHNVEASHDAMVVNFNKINLDTADESAEQTAKLAACYRNKNWDFTRDKTYCMSAPLCANDLYQEGIDLNHCVGSYANDIINARGSMLIFFMRYRRHPNRSLVTVQVNRMKDGTYFVAEAAGEGNRSLNENEKKYLESWMSLFNGYCKGIIHEKPSIHRTMNAISLWCAWAVGKPLSVTTIGSCAATATGTNEAVLLIAKKSIDDIKARAEKYIKDGGTMSLETYMSIRLAAMYGFCADTKGMSLTDFLSLLIR